MRLPPFLVRRLVLAPVLLVADAVLVLASPVLALVAAFASAFGTGRRPLQVLVIAVTYAARHLASTVACFALWVASGFGRRAGSPGMVRAHYALMGWFVGGVYRSMTRVGKAEVRLVDSDAAREALSARERPVIVLSRHAGEGDSLLVLHELLCHHGRRPRIVMNQALRLDPLIDVLGRRLPNRFIDPRGGDTEKEIAAMADGLGPQDAVLIFPEGGNFSAARRTRGIERLHDAGHHEEADWARDMTHVAAPRPGGALAALDAAPGADVVFLAHHGVPIGAGELWRRLPEAQTVELRLWIVRSEDIPRERDEQIDWLFARWRSIDVWVGERAADA